MQVGIRLDRNDEIVLRAGQQIPCIRNTDKVSEGKLRACGGRAALFMHDHSHKAGVLVKTRKIVKKKKKKKKKLCVETVPKKKIKQTKKKKRKKK
eukprot:NODE_14600_length_1098_cov_6.139032.p3 GENE.NODE_14600_length_1098_cov_6.139032~~NODE_14600_length_1098_cov_6.139032.p3  ORF type:complete len:95 (+),score=29.90 NODE_14600_length_1098_cov_6.139032:759-1043(+)